MPLLKFLAPDPEGSEGLDALVPEGQFPLVARDELAALASLGGEVFGEGGLRLYGLTRLEFYERLWQCNPQVFRFILDTRGAENESPIAGFTCVLPLRKSATEAFVSG